MALKKMCMDKAKTHLKLLSGQGFPNTTGDRTKEAHAYKEKHNLEKLIEIFILKNCEHSVRDYLFIFGSLSGFSGFLLLVYRFLN